MDVSSDQRGGGVDVLVDEIETNFRKFVRVEGAQETYPYDGDDNSDEEESEEIEPFGPEHVIEKCAGDLLSGENDEPETAMRLLFSEESTQPAVQLVSAMKGSREKLGASPRKLTVSWAPDVYDPIPNSLSHAVKSKQKKSRKDRDRESNNNYKKNGKKGQKGNSRGKDKKQLSKAGGRSDRGNKMLYTCETADDLGDFDVGSPDYCGSSFLKNSTTNFHYSVTEAL